jgi:hypothetical protein
MPLSIACMLGSLQTISSGCWLPKRQAIACDAGHRVQQRLCHVWTWFGDSVRAGESLALLDCCSTKSILEESAAAEQQHSKLTSQQPPGWQPSVSLPAHHMPKTRVSPYVVNDFPRTPAGTFRCQPTWQAKTQTLTAAATLLSPRRPASSKCLAKATPLPATVLKAGSHCGFSQRHMIPTRASWLQLKHGCGCGREYAVGVVAAS